MTSSKSDTASNSPDSSATDRGKAVAAARTRAAAKAKDSTPKRTKGRSNTAADAKRERDRLYHAHQRRIRKDALIKQQELSEDDDDEDDKDPKGKKASDVPNNGRYKGRKLIRWSPFHDQALLLCIQYECHESKIELPWQKIADRLAAERQSTAMSIIQHINKLRASMLDQGRFVTPLMGRKEQGTLDNVRGVVKIGIDVNGCSVFREVGWNEDLTFLFNPKDIQSFVPRGQHVLSSPATLKRSQAEANDIDRAAGVLPKVEIGGAAKRRARKKAAKFHEIDPADLSPEDDYEPGRYQRVKRATNRVKSARPKDLTEDSDDGDDDYPVLDQEARICAQITRASMGSVPYPGANSDSVDEQFPVSPCDTEVSQASNVMMSNDGEMLNGNSQDVVLRDVGAALNDGHGNGTNNSIDVDSGLDSVAHRYLKTKPVELHDKQHVDNGNKGADFSETHEQAGTSGAGLNDQNRDISLVKLSAGVPFFSISTDSEMASGKAAEVSMRDDVALNVNYGFNSTGDPMGEMNPAQGLLSKSFFKDGAVVGLAQPNISAEIFNNQPVSGFHASEVLSSDLTGNSGHDPTVQLPIINGSAFPGAVPSYIVGNNFGMAAAAIPDTGGSFSSASDSSTGVKYDQSSSPMATSLAGAAVFDPNNANGVHMGVFSDFNVGYDSMDYTYFPETSGYGDGDTAQLISDPQSSSDTSYFYEAMALSRY